MVSKITSLKILSISLLIILIGSTSAFAQERTVENRPYCDLRPFHFGVVVGTNLEDLEFVNAGLVEYVDDDGNIQQSLKTCDQDKWDTGFHVGVLGEIRLNTNLAFRIAPTIYFGTRHLRFHDLKALNTDLETKDQNLKSVYIGSSFDLIFAAPRFNNHRPYIMAGVSPMLNLNTRSNDYVQLKRSELFFEVGMGCDLYLPFFKLRPELKFMLGMSNALNMNHVNDETNKEMIPYAKSVTKATSKMIALTFYFE